MRKHTVLNISLFTYVKPSVMPKWLSVFLCVLVFSIASFAQSALVVEGAAPKLFLNHKVSPKENFYSVSRKYNVPPKDIAAYNNLQFEKGLNVGETIKIPLSENNFSQDEASASGKNLIPVYHSVLPKEGLYRMSINYNKVPLGYIKKWNHLQSDDVSIGTTLIVGYLKVNKTEVQSDGRIAMPGAQIVKLPQDDIKTSSAPTEENPKKPSPQVAAPDVDKPVKKSAITTQSEELKTNTINAKSSVNFAGGYFKKLYDDQVAKKSIVSDGGNAGIFKSTSGWQDGKYYCFNNDAPPGSVIKVTSSVTNKSVYAKVLDAIPDIKQNSGLTIIVSNAAAEELGAGDKFMCVLSYVK